jgi:hypothetical protein
MRAFRAVAYYATMATILTAFGSIPAQAQEAGWGDGEQTQETEIVVVLSGEWGSAEIIVTSSGSSGEPDSWVTVEAPDLRPYRDPDSDYDGYCLTTHWYRVTETSVADAQLAAELAFEQLRNTVLSGLTPEQRDAILPFPDCPGPDRIEIDLDAVYDLIDHTVVGQLALPTPWIGPGEAITGMRAYLETGRPLTYGPVTFSNLPLGDLTADVIITATATYDVDWGDGTVTNGLTDPGGPYPDGRVTHLYSHAASEVVVAVTDTWTITADIPGIWSETITRTLPAQTFSLPVTQVQAVVTEMS